MRVSIITLTLLTMAPIAAAAPVHADPKIERAKLELLWKDLHATDSIVRVRAVLALVDHPQSAAFLGEKIRPLSVSKEQIEQWLKELNSDEEKNRDRAFAELQYYDPRLMLSLAEQIELATTNPARRKLIDLWVHSTWSTNFPANSEIAYVVARSGKDWTDVDCRWECREGDTTVKRSMNHRVVTIRNYESPEWTANALAAVVLERIGSRSAMMTLDKLATGHPDALPTRTAIALLQHGPPAPITSIRFESEWKTLAIGNPIAVARKVLAFAEDPNAAKLLKAKLPAIKAEKVQIKKWLVDLNSDKIEVWLSAYESLQYFHPQLAIPLEEQIRLMTEDRSRWSLFNFHDASRPTPKTFTVFDGTKLEIFGELLWISHPERGGGKRHVQFARIEKLETLNPPEWQRARLAILALERNASADAVIVLKQLADGHPGILPTREAKAALKKLGM